MADNLNTNDEQPLAALVARLTQERESAETGTRALESQLTQIKQIFEAQSTSVQENTKALLESARVRTSEGIASNTTQVLQRSSSFLGGFLGLSPIVSGLMKLFGGGSEPAPLPALPVFRLPSTVSIEGGITGQGSSAILPVSTSQSGLTRIDDSVRRSTNASINVTINALDARGVLERSDDIARAVREAMLHSHALNDVIGDM